MRGGANGGRIRLAPQNAWESNDPAELATVLKTLTGVQAAFNKANAKAGKNVSIADLVVLGGSAAVEAAAKQAGFTITVPFVQGRTDASAEMTDVHSFNHLKPSADGFRNYVDPDASDAEAAEALIERADLLTLSAPEMTVLLGGMRAMAATHGGSTHGVLTDSPGQLNNAFFVNLLDNNLTWSKSATTPGVYEGRLYGTDTVKWTGTAVDLVFGSNSQLRALAEVYASDDAKEKFVKDFVSVWSRVMSLDRFDLEPGI